MLDPVYGPFTVARMLAGSGSWIHNITAAILAFQLTRSAFVVALVSVAQFLPQLLLAPWSGALADRGSRTLQIIVGRCLVMLGSGGMALWLWLVDARPEVHAGALVASSVVGGVGFVTGGPAMQAIVPSLVRRTEIASAVTLGQVPMTIGRAAGPAIGSVIALAAGPTAAFAVATVCSVPLLLVVVRIRLPRTAKVPGADRSIRAALTHVLADRPTLLLLLGVAVVGIGSDPAITLAPSIATELAGGPEHAGTFASAFGVGAGLGFVVIRLVRSRLGLAGFGVLGFLLTAVGLGALTVAWAVGAAAVGFGLGGAGMTLSLASLSAQLQERVPDELRGRIMAFWSIGFLGSRPMAAALNGGIADLVSVDAALLWVAAIALGAAWMCRPSRVAS